MHAEFPVADRVVVSAVAVLAALVYGITGARIGSCAEQSATARYVVAGVTIAIAALTISGVISPVVSYGMLCVALVSVFVVDTFKQECERKRRVASLTIRPVADVIPTIWIVTAAASTLMLTPYVVLDEQRTAALLVGSCSLAIITIAWRVATAPTYLASENPRVEGALDRAMRGVRSGLAAVLAVGNIFVFMSFVNPELPTVAPFQSASLIVSKAIWVVLGIWVLSGGWRIRRLAQSVAKSNP